MKKPRQIAFYGKGGIGKSTITSNLAAACAEEGLKVMVIGCDPKADCTHNLRGEVEIPTVLDVLRENEKDEIDVDKIVYRGYNGVLCVEAGGPEPAVGCAGRGIIVAVDLLKSLGVYDEDLDLIIYDVLGDVVCGGFGMPLRQGLAEQVFIVTSADYLAIYAANNICKGIERHAGRKGSLLGGVVYNVRGVIDDIGLVCEFAERVGTTVVGAIPNDPLITESELYGRTVIEHKPDSTIAGKFRELAGLILENEGGVTPHALSKEGLADLAQRIRKKMRERLDKRSL
ncbi:MAG: nucleotide-binding protein [Candidatus Syntropharchaeales archaeon]